MDIDIYQVDSFTSETFKGNPAGVCITESGLEVETMLAIASEMAVSETAFLSLKDMKLRWFTPKVEVALCGHGTLAVVHVMQQQGLARIGQTLSFQTLSGELTVELQPQQISLDFPVPHLTEVDKSQYSDLLDALGLPREQITTMFEFDNKQMIVVENESVITALTPDFSRLLHVDGRGVIVTAISENTEADFISRYFAPWVGVNEDPVTGSAHCALAQYWCERMNKKQLTGYQASLRGGTVTVELASPGRVKLAGQAKLVIEGKMYL